MRKSFQLKTSYACPWALVYWGGDIPGQRRRIRLAFITECIVEGNRIVGFKARTRPYNGAEQPHLCDVSPGWTKTERLFAPHEIFREFRHPPTYKQIVRARRRAPKAPAQELG